MRFFRSTLLAPTALLLGACDIPTDAPIVDGTWIVPVAADSVSVRDLLPSDVTVSGNAFVFTVPAASGQSSLGALCNCPSGVGPKPAFAGSVSSTVTPPSTVAQATLSGADLQLAIVHDLGFDPIRPSATARGSVTITIRSGGVTLASRTLAGTSTALPSGVARNETIALPAGSVVTGTVELQLAIDSPAGDVVATDVSRTFRVTATPANVRASTASVRVLNEVVTPTTNAVDIGSVSTDIRSKILSAGLDLQLANPFAVGGTFQVRFRSAGADVIPARTVTVAGGNETLSVALTKTEIDALFSAGTLDVEFGGSVSGTAAGNLVTVQPTQVVRVTPRLRLATRIGA